MTRQLRYCLLDSHLGSEEFQIDPKLKTGNFSNQILVHKMYWNLIWKFRTFFPILDQFDFLGARLTTCIVVLLELLSRSSLWQPHTCFYNRDVSNVCVAVLTWLSSSRQKYSLTDCDVTSYISRDKTTTAMASYGVPQYTVKQTSGGHWIMTYLLVLISIYPSLSTHNIGTRML